MSTHSRPILVFGCKGQVGSQVCQLLLQKGYEIVTADREECDLSVPDAIHKIINSSNPQAIINAAAYTAVDRAESEPSVAETINAVAPTLMAEAAKEIGALFVHYSTDYVFDGNNNKPWLEEDSTRPLNVYGQTKLRGEKGILATGAAFLIFRTSWVYGAEGSNFLRTMLKLGRSKDEITVVSDQFGAPTWSHSLAALTVDVIGQFWTSTGEIEIEKAQEKAGIYHATCAGSTSWHDFACHIFDSARACGLPISVKSVIPISTAQYPCAATRPKYSVLSNAKLKRELGYKLPHWREALHLIMREVVESGSFPKDV